MFHYSQIDQYDTKYMPIVYARNGPIKRKIEGETGNNVN